ncbi:MAG: hypothetical protein DBX59_09690 [Bacillota bacterium]|nr:MAG: hypothetical protein DBX59_09690 [Bacillota bacterium]
MKASLSAIAAELKKYAGGRVAAFMHVRPDGDAVGSALGLRYALKQIGVFCDVYCADPVPEKFFFLQGAAEIKREFSGKYDAHFAVDCSDAARMGELGNAFLSAKTTFNVDHHVSNARYAKFDYVAADKASNSENILELYSHLGVTPSAEAATALLTGVITDSGNFAHENAAAETLFAAAKLKEYGADSYTINYKMFKEQTAARAKLFGMAAANIRYFHGSRVGLMTITGDMLEKSGAKADETEGFIDFLMGVKTVEVGMCAMEVKDKTYKVSFRSKKTDVNAVASTFGGGGHVLASGCMLSGYYEDVVDRLVSACKRFMD